MTIKSRFKSECFKKFDMHRRRGNIFFTSYHNCCAHKSIIHNMSKWIWRHAVTFEKNKIFGVRLCLNFTFDKVIKFDTLFASIFCFQSYCKTFSIVDVFFHLFIRKIPAWIIFLFIIFNELVFSKFQNIVFPLSLATKTRESLSFFHKFFCKDFVNIFSLTLHIWAITSNIFAIQSLIFIWVNVIAT